MIMTATLPRVFYKPFHIRVHSKCSMGQTLMLPKNSDF